MRVLAAILGSRMRDLAMLSAAASALTLLAMVTLIVTGIFTRNILASSLNFTVEFVGYCVAAITFNGLSYAFQTRQLIRVNLLSSFASQHPILDRIMQTFAIVSTSAIVTIAIMYFWDSVVRNYSRGSVSETSAEIPLWIPEAIMLFGLLVFNLQLLVALLNLFLGNTRHDGGTLGRLEKAADDF